jgi:DNA-binding XRE family transcriptional regulator
MTNSEFARYRQKLGKTQKEIAHLLGVSLKTVTSYEQGWRKIPPHVERQVFFLLGCKFKPELAQEPCWVCMDCPEERKKECPSWEFNIGQMCWFICGTKCKGCAQDTWSQKMKICRTCDFFKAFLEKIDSAEPSI